MAQHPPLDPSATRQQLWVENSGLRWQLEQLNASLDARDRLIKQLERRLMEAYTAIRHVTTVRAAELEHIKQHTTHIDNSIHKDRALDL